MTDPHAWLDPIIAEQRRINGAAADLIAEVAEAPLPVGAEMDQWERDAASAARHLIEEHREWGREYGTEEEVC